MTASDENTNDENPKVDSESSSSPSSSSPTLGDNKAETVPESPATNGNTLSLSGASLVGCRLGDYQILRKLGRGGMADVYAARHLSLARDVAIKVLRSEFARDQDYVTRFRREGSSIRKTKSPKHCSGVRCWQHR